MSVNVGDEVRYDSARLEQTLKAAEDVKIEASEHTLTVNLQLSITSSPPPSTMCSSSSDDADVWA